jgi:hypothetical protein
MHVQRGEVKFPPVAAGVLLPFLALLLACLVSQPAWADGVTGFAEFDHTYADTTDNSLGARSISAQSTTLVQRYGLSLNRAFYPSLRLTASTLVERDSSDSTENGISTSGHSTHISPSASLSFGNPFLSGALGYARNEQSSQSGAASSPTSTTEVYTARVGMVPEGLPTLDFRFSRANAFSSDRSLTDNTSDSYGVSSSYRPLKNLDLGYQGTLTQGTDRVTSTTNESTSQSGSARYSDQFFGRANVFTTVTLSDVSSTFSSSSGRTSFAVLPISRLAGFFAVSDNPALVQLQPVNGSSAPPVINWTSTPGLIDGDKRIATNPLINLGVPPIIGGDTRLRNIGLDLAVVSTVNTLYVYVNQFLPASVTNQFVWSVYVSSDNQNWSVLPNAVQSVTFETVFDPLTQLQAQRFTILTANFATRYVKVVVHPLGQQLPPLPIGVDLTNILVTEMEAALRQQSSSLLFRSSRFTSQSGSLSSGLRVNLLTNPSLPVVTWDVSFNYNFSRGGSSPLDYNYFISTGLSAFYRVNDRVSSTSRLAWEEQQGSLRQSSSGVAYSISLDARPLEALSSNFIFSGRQSSELGKNVGSNSLNLTTTVALYQGIGANVSGGVSTASTQGVSDGSSTFLSAGLSLVPNSSLNANLSYSGTWNNQTVVGEAETTNKSTSSSFQVSYVPLETVSLFAVLGYTKASGTSGVFTQSYGGGWSPFRDSALQANVAYSQSFSTADNQKTTTVSPSLRWNIRSGWWLSTAYAYETVESTVQNTRTNSVTSTLRMSF